MTRTPESYLGLVDRRLSGYHELRALAEVCFWSKAKAKPARHRVISANQQPQNGRPAEHRCYIKSNPKTHVIGSFSVAGDNQGVIP